MDSLGKASKAWCLNPLVFDDWMECEGKAARELLERVNKLMGLRSAGWRATMLRARAVPFYGDWLLVEAQLADEEDGFGVLTALFGEHGLLPITGASVVFHRINPVKLQLDSEDKELDYLRLFCNGTHGEDGRFRIVEDGNSLDWQAESDTESARRAVSNALSPIRVVAREVAGLLVEARVLYGGTLFKSLLRIHSSGVVEMEDDDPVVESLPIVPERFAGAIRLAPEGKA